MLSDMQDKYNNLEMKFEVNFIPYLMESIT